MSELSLSQDPVAIGIHAGKLPIDHFFLALVAWVRLAFGPLPELADHQIHHLGIEHGAVSLVAS